MLDIELLVNGLPFSILTSMLSGEKSAVNLVERISYMVGHFFCCVQNFHFFFGFQLFSCDYVSLLVYDILAFVELMIRQ